MISYFDIHGDQIIYKKKRPKEKKTFSLRSFYHQVLHQHFICIVSFKPSNSPKGEVLSSSRKRGNCCLKWLKKFHKFSQGMKAEIYLCALYSLSLNQSLTFSSLRKINQFLQSSIINQS